MPLLLISYMLQFFDKTTLGYTAILGIQKSTVSILCHLSDSACPLTSMTASRRHRIFLGVLHILLWILDSLLSSLPCFCQIPSRKATGHLRADMGYYPRLPRRCDELWRSCCSKIPARGLRVHHITWFLFNHRALVQAIGAHFSPRLVVRGQHSRLHLWRIACICHQSYQLPHCGLAMAVHHFGSHHLRLGHRALHLPSRLAPECALSLA